MKLKWNKTQWGPPKSPPDFTASLPGCNLYVHAAVVDIDPRRGPLMHPHNWLWVVGCRPHDVGDAPREVQRPEWITERCSRSGHAATPNAAMDLAEQAVHACRRLLRRKYRRGLTKAITFEGSRRK